MTSNLQYSLPTPMEVFAETRTLPIDQVPSSRAWPLVKGTPEGTSLWQAMTEWRQIYQERLAAQTKLSTKLSKKSRQLLSQSYKTLGRRLARAYSTCCQRFQHAVSKPDNVRAYGDILEALADELGLEWSNSEKKGQLSFFSLLDT